MPKYKVLEKSLIGNEIFEVGAIVEYAGLPAENLEPQCKEGEAKYQEYLASNVERIRVMREQNSESGVGDTVVFAKLIAVAVAEAMAASTATKTAAPAKANVVALPAKNAKAESLT